MRPPKCRAQHKRMATTGCLQGSAGARLSRRQPPPRVSRPGPGSPAAVAPLPRAPRAARGAEPSAAAALCSAAPEAGAAAPRGAGRDGLGRGRGAQAGRAAGAQSRSPSRSRPLPAAGTRSGGQGLTTDRQLGAPAGAVSPPPDTPLPARGCGAAPRTLSPRRARLPADKLAPLLRSSQPQRRPPLPLPPSVCPPVHPPALSLSLPPAGAGAAVRSARPRPRFPGLCPGWAGTGGAPLESERRSCRAGGRARPGGAPGRDGRAHLDPPAPARASEGCGIQVLPPHPPLSARASPPVL